MEREGVPSHAISGGLQAALQTGPFLGPLNIPESGVIQSPQKWGNSKIEKAAAAVLE
jgi:hypothetical protein